MPSSSLKTENKGDFGESDITNEYFYDQRGNLIKEIQSNGFGKLYSYNESGLIKNIEYFDEDTLELETEYSYDSQGRIIRMSDYKTNDDEEIVPYRHTIYGYDLWGRSAWISELDTEKEYSELTDSDINKNKIQYTYDLSDRICKIDYPSTISGEIKAIKYFYNESGQKSKIIAVTKDNKENLLHSYKYDKFGNVSEINEYADFTKDSSTMITRRYIYDDINRISQMTYQKGNDVLNSISYCYDKNSNVTKKSEVNISMKNKKVDETITYKYDSLGQLIRSDKKNNETNTEEVNTYTYDDVGNRIASTINGESSIYYYNGLDQLTRKVTMNEDAKTSLEVYTYDKSGNEIASTDMLTGMSTESKYDPAGRLKERIISNGNSETFVQRNLYNGNNKRIKKEDNGVCQYYHYEGDILSYVSDEENHVDIKFLHDSDEVIASEDLKKQETYLYNRDDQGSVKDLLNQDGNSVTSYRYGDYGEKM